MGSFKGKGRDRNQGRAPRRGVRGRRFDVDALLMESLEVRVLPASALWHPTTTNLADVQNGPMANAGQDLIDVYQAYTNGDTTHIATKFPNIEFQSSQSSMVGVDINWNGSGSYTSYVASLKNLGMQVTAMTGTNYGIVEGFLPVSQLPTVAEEPQTADLHPIYAPHVSYQGVANNEGDAALKADTASQQYSVTGAGQKIGVLSDSVNQAANPGTEPAGIAGSISTGDLPAAGVQVIQDGPAGSTDEGRAMLENIYDIAPGASLSFASADYGELGFMQNIVKLQQAGAGTIVDDIGYSDEPMFQDGLVAQGVNAVTAAGATYLERGAQCVG